MESSAWSNVSVVALVPFFDENTVMSVLSCDIVNVNELIYNKCSS